jgi:hypothetical protein
MLLRLAAAGVGEVAIERPDGHVGSGGYSPSWSRPRHRLIEPRTRGWAFATWSWSTCGSGSVRAVAASGVDRIRSVPPADGAGPTLAAVV